jgi:methylaspartate ammonia-lyase
LCRPGRLLDRQNTTLHWCRRMCGRAVPSPIRLILLPRIVAVDHLADVTFGDAGARAAFHLASIEAAIVERVVMIDLDASDVARVRRDNHRAVVRNEMPVNPLGGDATFLHKAEV